jgi:predicted transcriptional regulator
MATTVELTQISTRVEDELLKRLDERCDTEKRSRSFVLYEALEKHLDADRQPVPTGEPAS